MANYQKFNQASLDFINGVHQFGTHAFKSMLSNVAPVATNAIKGNLTEILAGNGYSAGGNALTITTALVSGTTAKATVASDVTLTAVVGALATFQYVVLYNDTPVSPLKPLWCWWDYGGPVTLALTESFTQDYDQVNGLFTFG